MRQRNESLIIKFQSQTGVNCVIQYFDHVYELLSQGKREIIHKYSLVCFFQVSINIYVCMYMYSYKYIHHMHRISVYYTTWNLEPKNWTLFRYSRMQELLVSRSKVDKDLQSSLGHYNIIFFLFVLRTGFVNVISEKEQIT